jgi:hypothetical protein
MKPSTIQKNNSKSLILSLAGIALLSLMTSCTVDEIETLPKNNPTTTLIKEQFLQRGDTIPETNKGGDIDPPKGSGTKP